MLYWNLSDQTGFANGSIDCFKMADDYDVWSLLHLASSPRRVPCEREITCQTEREREGERERENYLK